MSRLSSNVCVDGKWYGPSYPDAGEPPSGRVTNGAAFEDGKAPKAVKAEDKGNGEDKPTIERTARDAEGVTRGEGSVRGGRPAPAQRRGAR